MSSPDHGRQRKNTDGHSEVLTVSEVASLLSVSAETVRRWIRAGDLPALHIGRTIRIRRDDITHRPHGHHEHEE